MPKDAVRTPLLAQAPPAERACDAARSARNFRVVLFTTFLSCCMYALIFPSMALYLRQLDGDGVSAASESTFLGYLVGGYSLTKFILSPAAGALANRQGVRLPLLGAIACLGAGSLLYGCARSRWELLGARLIIGVSGVSSTLARTDVAREARAGGAGAVNGRTAQLTMATSVGFIAGPALGAAVAPVRFVVGGTVFDALNLPGFISFALALANLALLLCVYREAPPAPPPPAPLLQGTGASAALVNPMAAPPQLPPSTGSINSNYGATGGRASGGSAEAAAAAAAKAKKTNKKAADDEATAAAQRRTLVPFLALLLLQFVIVTPFSAFESVTTPYCVSAYGWGVARIGLLFALGSAVAVPAAMALRPLTRKRTRALPRPRDGGSSAGTAGEQVLLLPPLMGDCALMAAGMVLMVVSLVIMTNVGETAAGGSGSGGGGGGGNFVPWAQFSSGMLLFYCGYVAAQTMLFAVLIKLLTGNGVPAGTRIGLVSACGSVARVVGPVWAMDLFADDATGRLVFLVNAAVVGVGLPVLLLSWKRLQPPQPQSK
jgi:MFS transporter, ceroid-lipofuscinosis neuronal protein 7